MNPVSIHDAEKNEIYESAWLAISRQFAAGGKIIPKVAITEISMVVCDTIFDRCGYAEAFGKQLFARAKLSFWEDPGEEGLKLAVVLPPYGEWPQQEYRFSCLPANDSRAVEVKLVWMRGGIEKKHLPTGPLISATVRPVQPVSFANANARLEVSLDQVGLSEIQKLKADISATVNAISTVNSVLGSLIGQVAAIAEKGEAIDKRIGEVASTLEALNSQITAMRPVTITTSYETNETKTSLVKLVENQERRMRQQSAFNEQQKSLERALLRLDTQHEEQPLQIQKTW